MKTLGLVLALAASLLASGCSGGSGTDCPDGILIDDVCWPTRCGQEACANGAVCAEGICVEVVCLAVDCPTDQRCVGGQCYPQDCPTRTCPGLGEVCADDECTPSTCLGVECPVEQACAAGRCYPTDCPTHVCQGYGEVCVDELCQERTCVGVDCPTDQRCAGGYCYPATCDLVGCDPLTEICVDGVCEARSCLNVACGQDMVCVGGWCLPEDCPDQACPEGQVCIDGQCQDEACHGRDCAQEQVCIQGTCYDLHCEQLYCPENHVCVDGSCIEEACAGMECPPGQICRGGGCFPTACVEDADCEDQNPCTDDRCDPDAGCSNTPNQAPCDDGDPCTQDDTCSAAQCGGDPLDADNDGYTPEACEGRDCDDGDPAISPESTEGPVGTATCGDGLDNDCDGSTDDGDTGCAACQVDADCDDGNACNGLETCQDQACLSGQALDCDDENPCTADACEPATGCTHDGAAMDGDECGARACQGLDWRRQLCLSGTCSGVQTVESCDDGNACTADACDPAAGCTNDGAAMNGDECGSRYCSGLEYRRRTCLSGSCSDSESLDACDDDNDCTADSCSALFGCDNDGDAMDGTVCGVRFCQGLSWREETCDSGSCNGWTELQSCDDDNDCTSDSCSAAGCENQDCPAGEYCYDFQGCYPEPTYTITECIDLGTDGSIVYTVTGRPGAQARKYQRHDSCGVVNYTEAPESPLVIGANGQVTYSFPFNAGPCENPIVGRWESFVLVDGHSSTHRDSTYYNSDPDPTCSPFRTCQQASGYCP